MSADDTQAGSDSRKRTAGIFHESAGAIVMVGDRWVLLRRGREWVFPKGHLEASESPSEAALREVREETGLDVEIIRPLGSTRYGFTDGLSVRNRKVVHWFLARAKKGLLEAEPSFVDSRLIDPEMAQEILTFPEDRELAARVLDGAALGPVSYEARSPDR